MLSGSKNFIDSPQNSYAISCPINKPLKTIPANIAPIAKIIKGAIITNGDSCILSTLSSLLLKLPWNVLKISLQE